MPSPNESSKYRVRTKSKTGCFTCKVRRIKCSEEKPYCLRCTSTGRKCEYKSFQPTPFCNREVGLSCPTSGRPSSLLPSGQLERRAFEFYFHYAAPSLAGVLDITFWRGTVLQVCRTEPLVWDAIISVGALYEPKPTLSNENEAQNLAQRNRQQAILWYQRSLAAMRTKIQRGVTDLYISLVSCTLFIAIEMLQRNIPAALRLYHQGMQLVTSTILMSGSTLTKSQILTNVAPIVLRMGTSSLIRKEGSLARRIDSLDEIDVKFATLAEARTVLYAIMSSWRTFDRDVDNNLRSVQKEDTRSRLPQHTTNTQGLLSASQQRIEMRFISWRQEFDLLPAVMNYISRSVDKRTPTTRNEDDGIIATMLMIWMVALVLVKTKLNDDEMDYDVYEPWFAEIISHASTVLADTTKKVPFIYEMGIGLPLFVTAVKCRNQLLRRKALYYLYQSPELQGMYRCSAAAQIAITVIGLEEGDISVPPKTSPSIKDQMQPQLPMNECSRTSHFRSDMKEKRIRDFTLSSAKTNYGATENSMTWLNYTYYPQGTNENAKAEEKQKGILLQGKALLLNDFSFCEYQLVLDYYHSFRSVNSINDDR